MREGNAHEVYQSMSAEDQRTFRQWLISNAVIASLFAGMLIVMAGAGGLTPSSVASSQTTMTFVAR
jgi:hypothetical protein